MTLWIKARRAHVILPPVFGLFAVLLVVLQGGSVLLPSLTGGSTQVVLALFVPIPLLSGLAMSLDSRLSAAEDTSIRPVPRMDGVLAITVVAAAALTSALVGEVSGDSVTTAVGRNTMFLAGLMLSARPWFGQPSVLLPMAWVLAVCLCGFRPENDPYPWTILPEPVGAPHAAMGAVLVFCAGLLIQLCFARKTR